MPLPSKSAVLVLAALAATSACAASVGASAAAAGEALMVVSGGVAFDARDKIVQAVATAHPVITVAMRNGVVRDRIADPAAKDRIAALAEDAARPPSADRDSLDLSRVFQTALDLCAVSKEQAIEVFILGRPAHKDWRDDLRLGRSNGGHFFLDDNEFAHLDNHGGCRKVAVYAVPPRSVAGPTGSMMPLPSRDEEFLQLIVQTRLPGGELVTFDPDGTIGHRTRIYETAFDRSVTRTAVIPDQSVAVAASGCPANGGIAARPMPCRRPPRSAHQWRAPYAARRSARRVQRRYALPRRAEYTGDPVAGR
jgi:hypothetical protein